MNTQWEIKENRLIVYSYKNYIKNNYIDYFEWAEHINDNEFFNQERNNFFVEIYLPNSVNNKKEVVQSISHHLFEKTGREIYLLIQTGEEIKFGSFRFDMISFTSDMYLVGDYQIFRNGILEYMSIIRPYKKIRSISEKI